MTRNRFMEIIRDRGLNYAAQVAQACQDRRLVRLVEQLQRQAKSGFPLMVATPVMHAAWAKRRRSGSPAKSLYKGRRRVVVQTVAERAVSARSSHALAEMQMMRVPLRPAA